VVCRAMAVHTRRMLSSGTPGGRRPVRRAGARPALGSLRGSENKEHTRHSPQATETTFGQHRHICAFFNSIDEQYRVLRPFIKDGFDRGDKAYH
jgi:hypothetical protein